MGEAAVSGQVHKGGQAEKQFYIPDTSEAKYYINNCNIS